MHSDFPGSLGFLKSLSFDGFPQVLGGENKPRPYPTHFICFLSLLHKHTRDIHTPHTPSPPPRDFTLRFEHKWPLGERDLFILPSVALCFFCRCVSVGGLWGGGVWLSHIGGGQFLQKTCKLLIPQGTSTEYQRGVSLFLLNGVFTLSW